MVRPFVYVYIEGGSEGRSANNDFRRGWKKFLYDLHELAMANGFGSLKVVRGKGRGNTFSRFKSHMTNCPNDLSVLLVDAETAVPAGSRVWDIVGRRNGDGWQCPEGATDRHLFLMVHFIETWLLTDREALQDFFKRGFDPRPLPTTNLEERSKQEVERALERATRASSKGPYRHGQAHEIIEFIRPEKVQTLWHGRRLFSELSSLIVENRIL